MPAATIADLRGADRILLYGVTGSGKSSAAQRIGEALELPVHLVDEEIGWLPGWVMRDLQQQRGLAAEVAASPRWVLDTAYGAFKDLVLPRTQVVVALDYPRWLSLSRLVRRTAGRWWSQELVCNGNTERASKILSADSIVVWHFRSYARKRDRVRCWERDTGGPAVLRLRHPRDLEQVLREL